MIASERETTATFTDADAVVRIFTCRRADVTALRNRAGVVEVESGVYADGTVWGFFEVPTDRFSIARAIRPVRSRNQPGEHESKAMPFDPKLSTGEGTSFAKSVSLTGILGSEAA